MNMLYVPLFTPPLDTEVGGERTTVQLVGATRQNGKYSFDFSELKRFMDFAAAHKIKYYEMSHLTTQWGAKACPKIMLRAHFWLGHFVAERGVQGVFDGVPA